jgi:hypothetical protein
MEAVGLAFLLLLLFGRRKAPPAPEPYTTPTPLDKLPQPSEPGGHLPVPLDPEPYTTPTPLDKLPQPMGDAALAAVTRARVAGLRDRAATGAAWRKDVYDALGGFTSEAYAGTGLLPAEPAALREYLADAISRWIGIESGGNPLAAKGTERGLTMLSAGEQTTLKIALKDYNAYNAAGTSRAERARIAVVHVLALAKGASKGAIPYTTSRPETLPLYYAKLRHALPLYVRELRAQGRLGIDIKDLRALKPSAALAPYGNLSNPKVTWAQTPAMKALGATAYRGADGLFLRFVTSAAVVADLE